MTPRQISNLEGLLDQLREVGAGAENVSVEDIRQRLGQRSFGPMLFIAGLPMMTPIGTVPGLPTTLAIIIMLTGLQMLLGLPHLWLPEVIRRRAISRSRLEQALDFIQPAARAIDKLICPRLVFLTERPFFYLVGLCCCISALPMPLLEFVPFTGGIPAFPVSLFGLALTVHDGILVLIALIAMMIAFAILFFLGTTILEALPL